MVVGRHKCLIALLEELAKMQSLVSLHVSLCTSGITEAGGKMGSKGSRNQVLGAFLCNKWYECFLHHWTGSVKL